jgi:hypothetical protein
MKDYFLGWNETEKKWIHKETNAGMFAADSDSGTLEAWTDSFLWIVGRGIVSRLVDIIDCHTDAGTDGKKVLHIHGKERDGLEWKVDLLPDETYMIRKATRFRDGKQDVTFTTAGSQLCGDFLFPENAVIEVSLGSKMIVTNYHIDKVRLEFDDDIYEEAREDIEKEMPRGSFINDESSGQKRVYVQGFEYRPQLAVQPAMPQSVIGTVIVVNVIIVSLIVYFFFCNRRKK